MHTPMARFRARKKRVIAHSNARAFRLRDHLVEVALDGGIHDSVRDRGAAHTTRIAHGGGLVREVEGTCAVCVGQRVFA